jgi:hypothetical protein
MTPDANGVVDLLQRARDAIDVGPPPPAATFGQAASFTRRRLAIGLVAAATAAAVATGLGVRAITSNRANRVEPTAPVTTKPPAVVAASPGRWALSLPEGDVPSIVYARSGGFEGSNHSFEAGVEIPAGALASLPGGGWLGAESGRLGVIDDRGEFEPVTRRFNLNGPNTYVLSTDHREVAVAVQQHVFIYDLESRQLLDRRPVPGFARLIQLTDRGLYYQILDSGDADDIAYRWEPGNEPHELTFHPVRMSADAKTAIDTGSDGRCTRIVLLDGDEVAGTLYPTRCGLAAPVMLAPDGQHALTRDWTMIDVASRTAQPVVELDGRGNWSVDAVWESSDAVLLTVNWVPDPSMLRNRYFLMRCWTSTLECERVFASPWLGVSSWRSGFGVSDPTIPGGAGGVVPPYTHG